MRIWRRLGLAVLLLASLVSGRCQVPMSSGGTDRSVWFNYFGDQPFTSRFSLHLEGSYRRTLGLSQFEQVLVRPGLTIVEGKHWQSLMAYTFIYSQPTANGSFGPAPIIGEQLEHRAFEQQIFQHRLLGHQGHAVTLEHRVRTEQRWVGTEAAVVGVANWRFSERARYRLTTHIPYGGGEDPAHYIAVFNEVYTSFGPHSTPSLLYSDVTYAAHGWKLSPHWSVEVGYQYRYQTQPGGVTGNEDHSMQIYFLSTAPVRPTDQRP